MAEDDRRKFLRIKKSFPFTFNIRGKKGIYEAKTFDISLGGVGFFSALPLSINDVIYLKIVIPGFKESMIIRGIVRWKNHLDDGRLFVGIEFFNIEKEEKDIILKSLREG